MAKITKHPRKTGATTVKKDGKIVGNIGKGKDKIPTSDTKIRVPQKIEELYGENNISPTIDTYNKFEALTILESSQESSVLSHETAQTLWSLTECQPVVERLNIASQIYFQLEESDRAKFLTNIHYGALGLRGYIHLANRLREPTVIPSVFSMLSQHTSGSSGMREILTTVSFKRLPPDVIIILSNDSVDSIRAQVASNNATPKSILEKFVDDPSTMVRLSLLHNKNLSNSIVEKLKQDSEVEVRACAKEYHIAQ